MAPGGRRRAGPLGDDLLDGHDAVASAAAQPHLITGPHGMAGVTRGPLTLTCPARQAPDAAGPVLAGRTGQIQLSARPA